MVSNSIVVNVSILWILSDLWIVWIAILDFNTVPSHVIMLSIVCMLMISLSTEVLQSEQFIYFHCRQYEQKLASC